jgi:hypothetical protein
LVTACDAKETAGQGEPKPKGNAKTAQTAKAAGKGTAKPTAAPTAAATAPKFAGSGIWKGNFKSKGFFGTSLGLVTETGDARFVSSEGVQLVGKLKVDGANASATFKAYTGSKLTTTYEATAKLEPKKSLAGDYRSAQDSGTFEASYADAYERKISLGDVATRWGSPVFTMTVDDQGKLSGKDKAGCKYEGTFALVDPRYNALELKFSVASGCPYQGDYAGLAFLSDGKAKNDLLVFGVSGAQFGHAGYLARGAELGGGGDILAAARKAHADAMDAHDQAMDAHDQAMDAHDQAMDELDKAMGR